MCRRRDFVSGVAALFGLSGAAKEIHEGVTVRLDPMSSQEKRNRYFALAIVHQQRGEKEKAAAYAHACLELCKLDKTMEDAAAGHVLHIGGTTVCLPDYLHEGTALQRFKSVGIDVS